jgi:hypothetical protein
MSTQQERSRVLDDAAVPGVGAANRAELLAREQRRADRDRRRQEHEHEKRARRQTSSRDLADTARQERDAERQCREAVTMARAERAKDLRWWQAGNERTLTDRITSTVMGETRPLWAEQTPHKATTANTAAIFPFYNEGGVGHRGIVVGLNLLGGGAFCFDPWNLYTSTSFHREPKGERIIKNGNMIVLGSPGEGKSSLVKTMAYRQAAFGRRCEFIDPKGEYGDVVNALGGVVVKLSPGGDQALNPLTDVGNPRGRRNLLTSLARALMGRSLSSIEKTGILAALDQADREADGRYEVCLPHVEKALRDPSPELAEKVNGSQEFAVEQLREVMLELQLLSDGPLAGMFDRPTTIPASTWDQDAISIDLSAIAALAGADDEGQNQPLAITMMCCSAFLAATADQRAERCRRESRPIPKTMRVNDEGWRVLAVPGQAQQYQSDFKLQRASGVANVVVMHRLSDLRAAGDDGSRAKKLAEGLRADADTIVIYRQDEGELADLAEQLKLSVSELDVVRNLGQAQALWQVGKWHGVVQHLRSSVEEGISNTDEAMSTGPQRRRAPVSATRTAEDVEQLDMLDLLDDDEDSDIDGDRLTIAEEDLPAAHEPLVIDAEDLDDAGER